jgi:ubiquinone/menaquinone biosynthesis C-methylase UbiE
VFDNESGLSDFDDLGRKGISLELRITAAHAFLGKEASMSYDKDQAAAEFTRWSESYDRSVLQWMLFGPSHRVLIRRIAAVSGNRPFRLLDVGCGTGLFARRLKTSLPHAQIWGVDLVSGMLSRGRPQWEYHDGDVMPVQGDSEWLPFGPGTFDFVTCANSFHHYPRQDRAVVEMQRVLRPGGRLLIIDGYRDAPWGWFIYDICVAFREGDVHHASARCLRDLMTRSGLQAIAQTIHRGLAPFLLSEGIVPQSIAGIPAPHFQIREGISAGVDSW